MDKILILSCLILASLAPVMSEEMDSLDYRINFVVSEVPDNVSSYINDLKDLGQVLRVAYSKCSTNVLYQIDTNNIKLYESLQKKLNQCSVAAWLSVNLFYCNGQEKEYLKSSILSLQSKGYIKSHKESEETESFIVSAENLAVLKMLSYIFESKTGSSKYAYYRVPDRFEGLNDNSTVIRSDTLLDFEKVSCFLDELVKSNLIDGYTTSSPGQGQLHYINGPIEIIKLIGQVNIR